MKLQPRKIIFIGSILLVEVLIQVSPLKAHERRFHIPKESRKPKIEKATSETKVNFNSSNLSQTSEINKPKVKDNNSLKLQQDAKDKTLNYASESEVKNISIVPKGGEIIFLLLIGGTLSLYYIKQKLYW